MAMIKKGADQKSFGWTYFHFADPSGTRINVIVHETDIFGLERQPYMTMIVKEPNKQAVRFKDKPNVIWKLNRQKKNGIFSFTFGKSKFSGTVEEIPETRKLANVILYEDKIHKKSMWSVDVPYGKIIAKLSTPKRSNTPINGYMYQDRQWGNLPIQEWVKDWTWTHLASENSYAILFAINSASGQQSRHSMYGQGKKIYLGNNFKIPHFLKLVRAKKLNTTRFQGKAKISDKLSITFPLIPEEIMRSRIDEVHQNFLASYVRWSVDGMVTYPYQNAVFGVSEYMRVRNL